MNRTTLLVSLAASLFVVAHAAQADSSEAPALVSVAGTSMENPQAIESPFPTQGPDDK